MTSWPCQRIAGAKNIFKSPFCRDRQSRPVQEVGLTRLRPNPGVRNSTPPTFSNTTIGLSQESLAHKAGLDRSYLGQGERGERNIMLDDIYRLSEALGVSPGNLL